MIKQIQDVIKFFTFRGREVKRSSSFVGSYAPFIGSDDKTKYVEDFERVKYVYAVISWIAKKSAKVPFSMFQADSKGDRKLLKIHRILDIIEKPNKYQSRFQFLYQAYGFLLSTGALYIYVPKLSSGRWTEMHVIPSNFVQPIYEHAFEGPSGFLITDTGRVISRDEMIFIFNESLSFEQVGVGENGNSPMNSLRTVTQKTKDIDTADLAAIQNGGVAGIITDRLADPMDEPQRARAEKLLSDKAYGPANKGKWLMTSGDISFIPIGLSPVDLNLYEANKQVLRDICIVYHIPYLIFDQTDASASFGTSMREAKKQAYTDAILPMVEMFCDGMNHYGFDGFGTGLVLDYDTNSIEEMQTDAKLLAETLNIQYWKTIGQKQRESGVEIDPKYENVYLIPSGLVRLEEYDIEAIMSKAKFGSNEIGKIFDEY